MPKDRKKTVNINVEIVDNLIQSLEWIITSINFWKINESYPCNLILKACSNWYYELRKLLYQNEKNKK